MMIYANNTIKIFWEKKLKKYSFSLNFSPTTLKELLEKCVKVEVKTFNENKEKNLLWPFLSSEEMREQASKIKIGDSNNNTLAVESEAIDNVFQSFKDRLFVVFCYRMMNAL